MTDVPAKAGPTVTPEAIAAAMAVNSVPDEVRVHARDPDETRLVIDGTGELRQSSEDEPGS